VSGRLGLSCPEKASAVSGLGESNVRWGCVTWYEELELGTQETKHKIAVALTSVMYGVLQCGRLSRPLTSYLPCQCCCRGRVDQSMICNMLSQILMYSLSYSFLKPL
jgi:hypothetical protein